MSQITNEALLLRRKVLVGASISVLLVASAAISSLVLQPKATKVLPANSQTNISSVGTSAQKQNDFKSSIAEQYANIPDVTLLEAQDLGTWSYVVTRHEKDGLSAGIMYKHDTVNDLRAYAETNRALIQEIEAAGGEAEVTLTFLPFGTPEWFRQWAKKNSFAARQTQLLTTAPGSAGTGTVIVLGRGDEPLPQSSLDSTMVNSISGVHGTYGTVAASRLSEIAADPRVALLDVTPAWLRLEAKRTGIANLDSRPVSVDLPYGYMERLGLQNFARLELPASPTIPLPIVTPPVQRRTIIPEP
jgi:hypothetical protein